MKAPATETPGYDTRKKIKGRKRHLSVDTDGRLLNVNLTTVDLSEPAGSHHILDAIRERWPWIKHLFADGAYHRRKLMDEAAFKHFVIEILCRIDHDPWFKLLPRRWVVERTFGWMTSCRRRVRDYEKPVDVEKAVIHVAMGELLLRGVVY